MAFEAVSNSRFDSVAANSVRQTAKALASRKGATEGGSWTAPAEHSDDGASGPGVRSRSRVTCTREQSGGPLRFPLKQLPVGP
jgi:hypothetical protein